MIYSVIPYDIIMSAGDCPGSQWISGGGRFFQIAQTGGQKTISRMVSTNPADYLKPEYAPGASISTDS
ncbi:MAG: YlzJ-like family protein [Oscillospiraceae bacterium]|nr:YlzJ-like family protein [Oscillospiraceae bacterium]